MGNIQAILAMLIPILLLFGGILLLSIFRDLKQLKASFATQALSLKQNQHSVWPSYQHHDHKHHHYIHTLTPKYWEWENSYRRPPESSWSHHVKPHYHDDHDYDDHHHDHHHINLNSKLKGKKARLKSHLSQKFKSLFHWKDSDYWDRKNRNNWDIGTLYRNRMRVKSKRNRRSKGPTLIQPVSHGKCNYVKVMSRCEF